MERIYYPLLDHHPRQDVEKLAPTHFLSVGRLSETLHHQCE